MRTRNMILAAAMLLCIKAGAQQHDTTAQCGFSRIDFAQLYPWFSPAAAHTTGPAMLRARPSAKAALLKKMAAGSRLYVVSDAPRTLWYQVIDPTTGKLGWMHGDMLEVEEGGVSIDSTTAAPSYDGPLKHIGRTAIKAPTVHSLDSALLRIVNHYPVPLTVLLAGKAYTVPPALVSKTRTRTLNVKGGRQGYIIIVPDAEIVDVFFGFADLAAGSAYEYQVEIQSIE